MIDELNTDFRRTYVSIVRLSCVAILLITAAAVSNAGVLSLILDDLVLTGAPNSLVTLTGTLQNSSGGELFLNGADANLGYSELTGDFTAFFTDAPLSLLDGASYSGPLLSVFISSIAIPGDYFGSFDIQGGIDGNASEIITSGNIQISVTTTAPEVSMAKPLGLSLLSIILIRRRFRRISNSVDISTLVS